MMDDIKNQLDQQQQTLVELEDELEMEISRVISLKNKMDPELIEDLEKIEEGLYVEVKMIHETKKSIEKILKDIKLDEGSDKLGPEDKNEIEKYKTEADKYKKRSEKIAKQLIQATEEIEELHNNMEKELKKRENQLKNEIINKLKDKDRDINEKLIEAQKREEQLKSELEMLKSQDNQDSEDAERMKSFFDKKIKNIKKTMTEEFNKREKDITEKVIVAYNKKKEKIYYNTVKEALMLKNRPIEVDNLLRSLRDSLGLAEDVYGPENFILCTNCGDVIHISQSKCPTCKTELEL